MRVIWASLAVLLLLGACATSPSFTEGQSRPESEVRCEQRTDTVFAILGEIDSATAECVGSQYQASTKTLVLDTPGGSIEAALEIGEVFAGRDLEMRVEGECNSSCANYFLPLAGRIVLSPDAVVLLHGSIDDRQIALWLDRRNEFMALQAESGHDEATAAAMFDELLATARRVKRLQDAFAEANDIPLGWLLSRQRGSSRVAGLIDQPPRGRAVLVEEALHRSCLKDAEIESFQENLERVWPRLLRRLEMFWARVVPSGDARCV